MSRCFPFPPPGYEKKARNDATDLLTKEKQKEKKHKKDKKDKEKRDKKEKNDKDRSKEKPREKKDRKEKRKDKDRDKEKEKTRISDEERVNGQMPLPNEEKLGSSSLHGNENNDAKYVHDLASRIKNEDKVSGSQMLQRNAAADQRGVELFPKAKESVVVKDEGHGKVNGQRNHIYERGLGKAFGENSHIDKERVERIPRLVEKESDKQVERKEKTKSKESNGKVKKHDNKDQEEDRKSRYKDWNEEKEKEERTKEINEPSKEQHKAREGGHRLKDSNRESLDCQDSKPINAVKLSFQSSASEGSLGKRKEYEMNGYIIDNGSRPNKFRRPVSASALTIENGRKLESCQTAIQFASEKLVTANNNNVVAKDSKINGLIASQRHDVLSSVPVPATVLLNQNGEASLNPPHPDTKYLSQVLLVPTVEELPDSADEEWLFSQSTKSGRNPSWVDETREVWAEARWIESADISALPYVIPY